MTPPLDAFLATEVGSLRPMGGYAMTTFLLALAIAGAAFLLLVILGACIVSGRLAEEEERRDPTP